MSAPAHLKSSAWWRRPSAASIVNGVVVAVVCLFVLKQLQPSQLLKNSLPAGGDMGAHVWQPAYLRDHLLPHFRLTGWAPDWYAGFPALVFYFPLPSLAIVVLSVFLPYGVAFKLITVLGLLTLPVAAFVFGRLSGFRNPGPACLAVATLPFLFDRSFTIYGGNIPSTLAGEFAFSISLSLALVFLGVVARGLENGRHRVLAAVLLAATGLCHVIPAFFAVTGAMVLLAFRLPLADWRNPRFGVRSFGQRLRWAIPAMAAGGLLAGFWIIPFLLRLPYTNDMGWEKITTYSKTLLPTGFTWVAVLAATGAVAALIQRHRTGIFLAAMTGLSGLAFMTAPQGRLWNARLLPFWFLCIWLMAGVAIAEAGIFFADALARSTERPSEPGARAALLATPALLLLAALAYVAYPLHVLPGGHENKATGTYSWLGFQTHDRSFVPDWVRWNYSGYQSPLKPRHDEYFALMATMGDVGRQNGCGRAMWEYEEELDGMGTPMAPMLLPYWTHGCIGSMEGLFFEASATTPYHFLNQSELSMRPSRAQRDLPYVNLNVPAGVSHLQLLGVKYYMALTPEAQGAADTDPRLHLVATSGPWKVHYSTGDRDRTWKVYEVAGTDEVAPLDFQPVVMKGVAKGGKQWLAAAVSWYQDPQRWSVPLAVSGPASWSRVDGAVLDPPRTPITDPPKVTGIRTGDDRITFDVDTIGKPVLVKASYFPNWRVSGAKGPYRVTPNEMVVIPTAPHVSLHYANTPVDGLGYLASFLGLVALVMFARKGRIRYTKRPLPPAQPAPPAAEPWLYYADLERQLAGVTANGGSTVDAASYFDEPVGLSRGDPPN